jgi:hypothetical protein
MAGYFSRRNSETLPELINSVDEEYKLPCYPPKELIFSAFNFAVSMR